MNQAIQLDSLQSARILQCACRARAEILVRPKARDTILSAHLSAALTETLQMCCPVDAGGHDLALTNMYCEFELPLEDGLYLFDSHVLGVRQRADHLELVVSWPAHILVNQRRRSLRQNVAGSSDVHLSRESEAGLRTCSGRLYNLSRDGMAFRVLGPGAAELELGQSWWACFELPRQEHCFKIKGKVSRVLPSSESGAVIAGLEFEPGPGDCDEVERLVAYLEQRQSNSTMGVGR